MVVVLVVAGLPLAPAVIARAATPHAPLPSNAIITLPGHGWGHGRGMGQYGSLGMARSGQTYSTIVSHYYANTTLTTRSAEDIRVLVETSPDVVVTSASPLKASWSNGSAITSSSSSAPFLRARYDGSVYRLDKSAHWNGPWTAVASSGSYVVFAPGADLLQLVFNSGSVRWYRGNIIARYVSSDGMRAINGLVLEDYLNGVVPRESPASWPAEALKSQSVAARSYALYKKVNARARGTMFDICATTSCQVYGGYAQASHVGDTPTRLEYASSNSAIAATKGKTLLYDNKPILAEFSSSTGGFTAPGSVAYQKAVPDPGDDASPYHAWTAKVTVADLQKKFPRIGRLVDVNFTRRNGYGDWGGRVIEMQLVGTDATQTISGSAFRSAFSWPTVSGGVRSTWFTAQYYRGEITNPPTTATVDAGSVKSVPVRITNTGNTSWKVGGPVRLATASDSPFAGSDWISPRRPSSVTRNLTTPSSSVVRPGEVAEFVIPLHADSVAPGSYSERFTTIADGITPMGQSFTLAIQVLAGWLGAQPDVLTNGSFEYGMSSWNSRNLASGDGYTRAVVRDGTRALGLAASAATKTVWQTVPFTGSARHFTLSGWNSASGALPAGGAIEATATAAYTDGTRDVWTIAFTPTPHGWTYGETAFTTRARKTLVGISVGLRSADQRDAVYFDAIRLVESSVDNASFEDGLDAWGSSGLASGDGATTAGRDGAASLLLAGGGTKRVTQSIELAGRYHERFTLSGWSRTTGSSATGGPMSVTLTFHNTDGTTSSIALPFNKSEHAWTFSSQDLTAPKTFSSAAVTISSIGQTGVLYVDDVRVTRSALLDHSFDNGLGAWRGNALRAGDGVATNARDGSRALKLQGGASRSVVQRISAGGVSKRRFFLSAWNYARGIDGSGGVRVLLVLRNNDGTSSSFPLAFPSTSHGWTYAERIFAAPKSFRAIDIYAAMSNPKGYVYFDAIRFTAA